MSYSEYAQYHQAFRTTLHERCRGNECCGWHLSECDAWYQCPCNARKQIPHPECDYEDFDQDVEFIAVTWDAENRSRPRTEADWADLLRASMVGGGR
jgi:hypothetical protein